MDSVTVQNPIATAQSLLSNTAVRQLLTMVGIAASVALGALVIMWTQSPDYNLLYANLEDAQSSEIVQSLEAANIPYKLQGGGVMVPAEFVHEARMKLAGEGLPSPSGTGLDMLHDEPGFGVSQFIETKRYNHGLETELGRTIAELKPVKKARVHIALAKDSVFVRDRSKTTASVMLEVRSGQKLESDQVDAIVYFLARSINGLEAENVTVVDQSGRMLNSPDNSTDAAVSGHQFEHTKRVEDDYVKRIEELLSPIVGIGKVRAQVVASLDYTQIESTKEIYDPDRSVLRSESTRIKERRGDAGGAQGIPGALSNQPPVAGNDANNNVGGDAASLDTARDAVRNFEVDRTISHTRQASGEIRRLSVAVIVDDRQTIDDEGNVQSTPRTEVEVQQLNALVREAVGFDEARGDTIQVINSSFETISMGEAPVDPKIWETPMFRDLLKQGLGVLLVLVLFFGALRPMSRSLIQAANTPQLAFAGAEGAATGRMLAVEDSDDEVAELPDPQNVSVEMRIDNARKLATENPETVANVVKDWVAEDG